MARPKLRSGPPKKILPTNKLALKRQLEILQASVNLFETTRKPFRFEEIGSLLNMPLTTVQQVRTFFRASGLWQKEGRAGFIPSRPAIEYYHAHQSSPDDAAKKLNPLLNRAWFAEVLRSVLVSGQAQIEKVVNLLLHEAELSADQQGQAKNLLYLMAQTGILEIDGSLIRKGALFPQEKTKPSSGEAKTSKSPPVNSDKGLRVENKTGENNAVEIRISIAPAVLAGWDAEKLQAFFGGIANLLSYAK